MPLPDFAKPPLVEVVLSVQFDRLERLGVPQLGLLWSDYRERFPFTESHPPLEPAFERFDQKLQSPLNIEVKIMESIPVPRVWFLDKPRAELVQIQQDRLIHNWRKIHEDHDYPRYEYIREAFQSDLNTFQDFLERESIGKLNPIQCEVTYINQIISGEGWQHHTDVSNVLTSWSWENVNNLSVRPEEVQFNARFIIPDQNRSPIGRLHVKLQPAYRTRDNKAIFVLELTARGEPPNCDIEGIFSFFDAGRECIVQAFAAMTSHQMHTIWRRRDEF